MDRLQPIRCTFSEKVDLKILKNHKMDKSGGAEH